MAPDRLWRSVYVLGVVAGAVILAAALRASVGEVPTLALAAVVGYGAFGAACAWLLARINGGAGVGPLTSGLAFAWGAFAATGISLPANREIRDLLVARGGGESWPLLTPFIEEPIKNLGVVIVLLLSATRTRCALSGLVTGSFVGLGFEVIECVVRSINNAITLYPAGQRDNLGSLATDLVHEVVRGSWSGHIVITGIAGFGIGYAMTVGGGSAIRRWAIAGVLVLVALAAHLLWNSHRFGPLYFLGQFGLLLFYLWLIRVGRRKQAGVQRSDPVASGETDIQRD